MRSRQIFNPNRPNVWSRILPVLGHVNSLAGILGFFVSICLGFLALNLSKQSNALTAQSNAYAAQSTALAKQANENKDQINALSDIVKQLKEQNELQNTATQKQDVQIQNLAGFLLKQELQIGLSKAEISNLNRLITSSVQQENKLSDVIIQLHKSYQIEDTLFIRNKRVSYWQLLAVVESLSEIDSIFSALNFSQHAIEIDSLPSPTSTESAIIYHNSQILNKKVLGMATNEFLVYDALTWRKFWNMFGSGQILERMICGLFGKKSDFSMPNDDIRWRDSLVAYNNLKRDLKAFEEYVKSLRNHTEDIK